MSYDEDVNLIRNVCAQSQERLPLVNREAAEVSATRLSNGPYLNTIAEQLKILLISDTPTMYDVGDIRKFGNTLDLEQAISPNATDWGDALTAIAGCIPGGTAIRPPSDENWHKAIDIGRSLNSLNLLPQSNARLKSVKEAGKRLREKGYGIFVKENAYAFREGELERATDRIVELFSELGAFDVLSNLFRICKEHYPLDFAQYLIGRHYALGTGERPPSIPFGFLLNLAIKVPLNGASSTKSQALGEEAFALSTDITSAMNIEPYSGFSFINAFPKHVEPNLREMALFDHIFTLRQWRFPFTEFFLTTFFSSDHKEIFENKLGWTPNDVVALCRTIGKLAIHDPTVISVDSLQRNGITSTLLERMLPFIAHKVGAVNVEYTSPLAAHNANLMFKPLVQISRRRYLLPAVSILGPAFYEAVIGALRAHITKDAVSNLQGKGLERVIGELLAKSTLPVTLKGEKYDFHGNMGECDFVLESDKDIVFLECKAKSLTRGAMAGSPGDALLDFAGGMFASQVQALRHERILVENGKIEFQSGSRLAWCNRRITRLSITLLDHGALQDRMVFSQMYPALQGVQFNVQGPFTRELQIKSFNKVLSDMSKEMTMLEGLDRDLQLQRFGAASLSIGQLEVFLEDIKNIEHLINRIASPMTYISLNPLFEFHFRKKGGIVT